jgi:hypothetical protein
MKILPATRTANAFAANSPAEIGSAKMGSLMRCRAGRRQSRFANGTTFEFQ